VVVSSRRRRSVLAEELGVLVADQREIAGRRRNEVRPLAVLEGDELLLDAPSYSTSVSPFHA